MAVKLDLENRGPEPWKAAGAALIGPTGELLQVLDVWQADAIAPGRWRPVLVEVEATERQARGPFLLKLWDEKGTPGVTLGGVMFPAPP